MVKNIIVILIILSFFGLFKMNAPDIVKVLPEWAKGAVFFVVLAVLIIQAEKFIFKNRSRDD